MSAASPTASFLRNRVLGWLAIALVHGLLAWTSIQFSRDGGQVAPIWLPNAAIVAIGLIWRPSLARLLPPMLLAHIIVLLNRGTAPASAITFTAANGIEIAVALSLARRILKRPDQIKDLRSLVRFLGAAGIAAISSALIGGFAIGGTIEAFAVASGQLWLAHAMAMMTITPILLLIEADRQDCRRRGIPFVRSQGVIDIALGAIAVTAIFAQTTYPLLFLAAPVILAVAVRQGSAGSALLLLVTAIIATHFTMLGFGPINLVPRDVHTKAALLQIFIFATFIATIPISLAHERLAEVRERTLTLVETMNEIPFSLDLAGRWTYVSRHWSKLSGRDRALPIGRRALATVPPEQRKTVLAAMSSLHAGEIEEAHFEFRANFEKPEPVYLSMRVRLLRSRDGSPEGFVGFIADVSRETLSQKDLAASEQRLLSLAENAPVGIFQFDNDGNATFLNEAWAKMHGMSVEEGLGKGWQRILDDTQRARYFSFADERAAGATTDVETDVLRADGTYRRVRAVTTALHDRDGNVIGRMGVVVDQSREYEAKTALIAALEEAKAASAAKDHFLAQMSHELRTPMNGVLGFAERLQESNLNSTQRRYASLISRSGEIMVSLLNDILDASRMRAGQLQIVKTPYDLAATITNACQHFEPLASRRSLQLRCTFASPLPELVLGDKQRLTQILNNLIGNAIKFTEEGWVSVYARIEPQYDRTILIVEVTDTGIGIAPEHVERIFEAFDQGAEDISARFGGTGLGLPIARGLAEQMGGSLSLVTSKAGKGSIFRLTLPLDIPADSAARAKPSREPLQRQSAHSLRVLVAEDNEINRHLMTDLLASSGCDLTMVPDGMQAIEAVTQAIEWGHPFDLVLMDLRMPVLDGIGAAKAIRALGIDAAALPIIAVTATVQPETMDACWQAGMQDYVAKPVTRAAIDAVFEKWRAPGKKKRTATSAQTAAPPLDPSLVPLLGRFTDQCRDCLGSVTTLLASWPSDDPARLSGVQTMAHSVAGLAATFAAPQLIAPAQALDLALDTTETETIEKTLLHMQSALQLYLASTPAQTSEA